LLVTCQTIPISNVIHVFDKIDFVFSKSHIHVHILFVQHTSPRHHNTISPSVGTMKWRSILDMDCAVCHKPFQSGQHVSTCTEGGVCTFHTTCMNKWAKQQPFASVPCPGCKSTKGMCRNRALEQVLDRQDDPPIGEVYQILDNGDEYSGPIRDNKPHGHGRLKCTNGAVYEGEFKEGLLHGKGRFVYPGGTTYEGQYAHGKKHGQGKKIFPDGTTYEGQYAHGKRHERSKVVFADGTTYEGQWKEGQFHGQGKMVYPDGTTYEGQWKEGQFHVLRFDSDLQSAAKGIIMLSKTPQKRSLDSAQTPGSSSLKKSKCD
jgi:hypothetical protein